MGALADFHARKDREPELVTLATPRDGLVRVLAVEEREPDDAGIRVMRLEAKPGPGFERGDRVLVDAAGRIVQLGGVCRVCAAAPGALHRAWCPRRPKGANATVTGTDAGLLRGWSS